MNAMLGVTSSSPAYVFKFINAIYEGSIVQGISDGKELMNAICDVVIGSAEMLKASSESPKALVDRVASKGGTTERALSVLDSREFDSSIIDAMRSCTERANELGAQKK
jgi:pyrroline-5-carboxylate reductase